jgi:hypothetical protein
MTRLAAAPSPLRRLLCWRPLQALALLALGAITLPAAQWAIHAAQIPPGGLSIDTAGATGTLRDHRLSLTLPVDVYNGSDQAITGLALWVRAYACPRDDSPLADCAKLLSTAQNIPMRLMPGASLHTSQTMTSGTPAHLPGEIIRILRQIETITDDRDETDRLREERLNRPIP